MQGGLYLKWAQTLLAAEAAPDGTERILSTCRLLLSLCADTLRVSTASADKPSCTLERHQLQQCKLGENSYKTSTGSLHYRMLESTVLFLHADSPGSQVELKLQELASYDAHIKFWQPEETAPTRTLALMQMILQPVVSLRSHRFSSSKRMKIKLPGLCSVQLADEVYSFTLPKLLIKNLSEASADIELAGKLPGHGQCFN